MDQRITDPAPPPGTGANAAATVVHIRDLRLNLASQTGDVAILNGISFDIGAGETISIVGPSGSGKTSLLMVMAGLEQATSGTVEIAGTDFLTASEDALATARGAGIGVVFQSFHLVPSMTALENVALPLEFAGRPDAMDTARDALGSVGLEHRLSHFPGQLSGGEQQRVAIARATVHRPQLLLADEPTGNLDSATGDTIIDLLLELHHTNATTLVLVTHDHALASRCSRVLTLKDGRIAGDHATEPAT